MTEVLTILSSQVRKSNKGTSTLSHQTQTLFLPQLSRFTRAI